MKFLIAKNWLTLCWSALVVATVLTWLNRDESRASLGAAALFVGIAVFKGHLVALDFMELRHAPALWRWLVMGWLILISAIVFTLYAMAKG